MRVWLLAAMWVGVGVAQTGDQLQPLKHGQLVVWVVKPSPVKPKIVPGMPAYKAPDPGFHETTPSGLGQNASTFGQNAASYGVDANSATISVPPSGQVTNAQGGSQTLAPGYGEVTTSGLGKPSSDSGTTAGSYGQTAGSFGTEASNHGQTAGSYGQTAGSYGHSLSTIADAGKPVRPTVPKTLEDEFVPKLEAEYPGLKMQVSDLQEDQLRAALRSANLAKSLPDVLLYVGFPIGWAGPVPDVRAMEQTSSGGYAPDKSSKPGDGDLSAQCVVLKRAPHPKEAAALLLWLEERGSLSAPKPGQ
jgi:hypothetical protein